MVNIKKSPRVPQSAICPNCGRDVTNKIPEREFLKNVGICSSCSNNQVDISEDQKDEV